MKTITWNKKEKSRITIGVDSPDFSKTYKVTIQ